MNILSLTNNIVSEIETKVTPENIRAGVTAFGVRGSVTPKDGYEALMTYNKNMGYNYTRTNISESAWYNSITSLSKINLYNMSNPSYMFAFMNGLLNVDIVNVINSSNVNASSMFFNDINLKSTTEIRIDNVFTATSFFYNCFNLTDVSDIYFSGDNMFGISSMFHNCYSLTNISNLYFNSTNAFSTTYMFANCYNLTNIPNSVYFSNNVSTISYMFANCYSLTSIPDDLINDFNVNSTSVFRGCSSLERLPNWYMNKMINSNPMNFYYQFAGCNSNIIPDQLDMINTQGVTDISGVFSGSTMNRLPNWDLSNVTTAPAAFSHLNIPEYDVVLNLPNLVSAGDIFHGASVNSVNITLSENVTNLRSFCYRSSVKTIRFLSDTSKVTDIVQFAGESSMLENIYGLNLHSAGSVTVNSAYGPVSWAFTQCTNLRYIDIGDMGRPDSTSLSTFNFSNMFVDCYNLHTINGIIDFTKAIVSTFMQNCHNLVNVRFHNLRYNISKSKSGTSAIPLQLMHSLSKESIDYLVNNIYDYSSGVNTYNLCLNANAMNAYTEEEINNMRTSLSEKHWDLYII